MGDLAGILSSGKSSLLLHQSAIATASQNTSNASTPGYSKRDVSFESLGSSGVAIDSIRRRADSWIQQRMLRERSRLGTQEAKSHALTSLELQFGPDAGGVGAAIDGFFAALSGLATSPTDATVRADVLAKAKTMVESFAVTSERIEAERRMVDDQLELEVARINELAAELAHLNERIPAAEAATVEASADRDRRDVVLLELSALVDVSMIDHRDGTVTVLMGGGRPLVQESSAARLEAVPDAGLGGLRRIDYVDEGGLRTDVSSELAGGSLGGLVELRDGVLADMVARMDELAFDFATAFNAQHAAGFGMDGTNGRSFFDVPPTSTGAAGAVRVSATIEQNPDFIAAAATAAEAHGGNGNLLLLSGLANSPIAAGGLRSPGEEVADIVATIGREVASQRSESEALQMRFEQVQSMNAAQTGVSVDEELIDITRFQRAYQAAARIIQTVDEMYDTVLQL